MNYPGNRDFIFTIFDDTDISTLEYIRPIYDFLNENNIKITKTVWPLSYEGESDFKGSHTLEDARYADYVRNLRDYCFEIGFHGPTMVSSKRDAIIRAFEVYHNVLGEYPRIYAPHAMNRENLYWGHQRFTFPFFQLLYKIVSKEKHGYYKGHENGSDYYWGDIARKYLDYVRSFTYNTINLQKISNKIVYHNPYKPYAKNFFFTCDAENVEEFNALLNLRNQKILAEQKGICIISTHFGKGFMVKNGLNEQTKYLLSEMIKKNCWVAPVSVVLDYLKKNQTNNSMNYIELVILELRWLLHFIKRRKVRQDYNRTELPFLLSEH